MQHMYKGELWVRGRSLGKDQGLPILHHGAVSCLQEYGRQISQLPAASIAGNWTICSCIAFRKRSIGFSPAVFVDMHLCAIV